MKGGEEGRRERGGMNEGWGGRRKRGGMDEGWRGRKQRREMDRGGIEGVKGEGLNLL